MHQPHPISLRSTTFPDLGEGRGLKFSSVGLREIWLYILFSGGASPSLPRVTLMRFSAFIKSNFPSENLHLNPSRKAWISSRSDFIHVSGFHPTLSDFIFPKRMLWKTAPPLPFTSSLFTSRTVEDACPYNKTISSSQTRRDRCP